MISRSSIIVFSLYYWRNRIRGVFLCPEWAQSDRVCVFRHYPVHCSFLSTFLPLVGILFTEPDALRGEPFVDSCLAWRVKATCIFALWCSLSFCSPREECICAQTLLLQLLQSCFSVLQGDVSATSEDAKAPSMSRRRVEAAKELYTHLCDGRDWGSSLLWPWARSLQGLLL